jgi:dTMP kinase
MHHNSFNKNPTSFLLSFEGIEGSGKSTQIQLLTEKLKTQNKNVTYLREPGGTQFGEKLRSAILESSTELHPLAEAHLFASARAQILFEKVMPTLERENQIIILDRYKDSSIAYQGFARKLGAQTIIDLHKNFPLNIQTDLTFYLAIDLKTSMQRQAQRGQEKDYFEKSNQSFYEELIKGYEYCANEFANITSIDATKSIDEVALAIENKINELLA